jgi:nucleoside-diphosphate-sugar epimerase
MVNTVAIRGHDGNVGRHVLPHLVKAHQQGLIRLVILHRPSSDTSKLPSNIELRVIDTDTEEGRKQLPKQLAGINALM